MVPGWFFIVPGEFLWLFMVPGHFFGSRFIFRVFQDSWLFFIVPGWYLWFFKVPGWFFMVPSGFSRF